MKGEIRIQKQNRKSLTMKVTPGGIVVLIPRELDAESPPVQDFIEAGLRKIRELPSAAPSERLTVTDLHGRVETWSERIGVQIKRVQIRTMRNKWASCSTSGTLTLSTDLVQLPLDLVDYIICHELVHLRVPAHGKGFRALMGCYIPDWEDRERSLTRCIHFL
jgi:hypothetical protein